MKNVLAVLLILILTMPAVMAEVAYIGPYGDGLLTIGFEEDGVRKYGCIDRDGNLVIPVDIGFIDVFSEGLAFRRESSDYDAKYYLIDRQGNRVGDKKFNSIYERFTDGLASVVDQDSQPAVINRHGENIGVATGFVEGQLKDGYAVVNTKPKSRYYPKYGVIDSKGNLVIDGDWEAISLIGENRVLAQHTENSIYILDLTGKEIALLNVKTRFSEGLAAYYDISQGKYGYCDINGNIVIPCAYEAARLFSDGFACVNNGWIDKSGKIVLEKNPDYSRIGSFMCGVAPVHRKVEGDEKGGVINKEGKEIIPCQWDILRVNNYGFVYCVDRGDYSQENYRVVIFDTEGNELVSVRGKDAACECGEDRIFALENGILSIYNEKGERITIIE